MFQHHPLPLNYRPDCLLSPPHLPHPAVQNTPQSFFEGGNGARLVSGFRNELLLFPLPPQPMQHDALRYKLRLLDPVQAISGMERTRTITEQDVLLTVDKKHILELPNKRRFIVMQVGHCEIEVQPFPKRKVPMMLWNGMNRFEFVRLTPDGEEVPIVKRKKDKAGQRDPPLVFEFTLDRMAIEEGKEKSKEKSKEEGKERSKEGKEEKEGEESIMQDDRIEKVEHDVDILWKGEQEEWQLVGEEFQTVIDSPIIDAPYSLIVKYRKTVRTEDGDPLWITGDRCYSVTTVILVGPIPDPGAPMDQGAPKALLGAVPQNKSPADRAGEIRRQLRAKKPLKLKRKAVRGKERSGSSVFPR